MRFSYDPQRLKEYARKNPGWNERVREQAALGFPRDPRNYRLATEEELAEYDRDIEEALNDQMD